METYVNDIGRPAQRKCSFCAPINLTKLILLVDIYLRHGPEAQSVFVTFACSFLVKVIAFISHLFNALLNCSDRSYSNPNLQLIWLGNSVWRFVAKSKRWPIFLVAQMWLSMIVTGQNFTPGSSMDCLRLRSPMSMYHLSFLEKINPSDALHESKGLRPKTLQTPSDRPTLVRPMGPMATSLRHPLPSNHLLQTHHLMSLLL